MWGLRLDELTVMATNIIGNVISFGELNEIQLFVHIVRPLRTGKDPKKFIFNFCQIITGKHQF